MNPCLRFLLIIVLIIAVVVCPPYWAMMRGIKLRQSLGALSQIRDACAAYAKTHEGNYPGGTTSNEAFRQLFIAGLIDYEGLFTTSEIDRKRPDGNIGTAKNGYLQALAPGECRLTYIRGLKAGEPDLRIPLFYMQSVQDDGEIWMLCCREGGESLIERTENGEVLDVFNGRQLESFSEAYLKERYGIAPQDILKPEGPVRDVIALARARKMKIRLIESAILTAIWLPFLLIYRIKHRRKPQPHPETPTPQA